MIRLDALTLKQLRALVAVADSGSLTAAATRLGLTTPAIHSQIKNLESAVEAQVLARAPGATGLVPTAAGEELVLAGRRIEAVLRLAGDRMAALSQGQVGHVTLAVVSTAKYFAPRLLRRLTDLHPEIDVGLRVGNREQVIAGLDQGGVDLAVMGRPPRDPAVVATPLGPHPHGIILPPDHPLARRDPVAPEDITEETFITREDGSGTRILMERYLERIADGHLFRRIEMDSNETIKQAVMAGLGIALLSLHTVTEEVRTGRLVLMRAPGLPIMRHWYLVHPAAAPLTAAGARIHKAIVDMGGTFLPR
ncbi:MAG: LysR family transcriptional regulator [Paracoccaceae bacterium]|nr:MAG: LysR family transcriptional regulator [Paracoccaceae bacterium]